MPAVIFTYCSLRGRTLTKNIYMENFEQKTKKRTPGRMLGQDRLDENSAKCLFRSGEIPSSPQTSIDKATDCVMKSERAALVRDSNPPSGHSAHTTAGDMWRAPARHLIKKKKSPLVFRKQATEILDPYPMAKNRLFGRFGRRAQDTAKGPTWFPRRRHLHSLPLPNTNRVDLHAEIESLSSHGLIFYRRVDNSQREKTNCAACSPRGKKKTSRVRRKAKKFAHFSCFH